MAKKKTSTLTKLMMVNGLSIGTTVVFGAVFGPLGPPVAGFGWLMGCMSGAASMSIKDEDDTLPVKK